MGIVVKASVYEQPVLDAISRLHKTSQNEHWYRSRLLRFAFQLNELYGGDFDLICVELLVKDYYLSYYGKSSIENSIDEIKRTLDLIGFPASKTATVINNLLSCIKTNYYPLSTEEKIVNDAILLAESGAPGIIRNTMIAERSQRYFLDAITNGKESSKFVYPESIQYAERENKFQHYFSELVQVEPLLKNCYPGKYIILEGNGGLGKNTQANLLSEKIKSQGKKVKIVDEPSHLFRDIEFYWKDKYGVEMAEDKPDFRLYSIIGDRMNQIQEDVIKDLQEGKCVISVRSFISMLVYQCDSNIERLKINFIHQFVPRPDIVIIYDADEEISLRRVMQRNQIQSPFDKLSSLKKHRSIYLDIARSGLFDFPIEIVDAAGPVQDVAEETYKILRNHIA